MRYHVKNPPIQGWQFEEAQVQNMRNPDNLLVRILIAKVKDEARLAEIFRNVPVVQDDPSWRCRTWVRNALEAINQDGRAVGTSILDWGQIETVARQYAGDKTEAGRFRDSSLLQQPKPTWDMLQERETVA